MRDLNSPEYKKWRNAVYRRDKHKCVMCGTGKQLNAHHIKTWAKYPSLRTKVWNGATLCETCHTKTFGCEEYWEEILFQKTKRPTKGLVDLLFIKYGKKEPDGQDKV